jgi:hypothetical protein
MLTGNDLLEKVKELGEPTNKISATELLEFIYKIHRLGAQYMISMDDKGYWYSVYYDWHNDNHFETIQVYIKTIGEYVSNNLVSPFQDFNSFNELLDRKLEQKEKNDMKEKKRRQAIQKLSREERDLLGIKL